MAFKNWEVVKVRYCDHAQKEVSLEAQLIFPAEFLPDPPPQVVAHRCSNGLTCNLEERKSCIWAGTNPGFDPFHFKG